MKIMPPLFVAMLFATLGALGQTCERTVLVGPASPGIGVADFEATLNRQALTVAHVEPLRSTRVLVFIQADYLHLTTHQDDFNRLIEWLAAIDSIPGNESLAYGLYAEKTIFSSRFSSDPQELRSSLDELIRKARSGALGRRDNGHYLLRQALEFFQQPQPGDSVLLIGDSEGEFHAVEPRGRIDTVTEGAFLKSGVRLFVLNPYYRNWGADIPFLYTAEGTGGHVSDLSSSTSSKRDEDANWRSQRASLLNGISKGYLVTLAVPAGIRGKDWTLKLRDSARSRLGIPLKAKLRFDYPDLLLCGASANGVPDIATADRR